MFNFNSLIKANLVFLMITLIKTSIVTEIYKDDCDTNEAIRKFATKTLSNPPDQYVSNPYNNKSEAYKQNVDEYLKNKDRVCGLKYDDIEKTTYHLKDFVSRESAETNNYIVTHFGRCGACSSTQDLSIYLQKDLTNPVRKCAFLTLISMKWAQKCIEKVGFTPVCGKIWLFNSKNTKNNCLFVCMASWISGEPNNKPNGDINDCLQCDEDISGPVFKYEAGRTRRNSGIHSEIDRPEDIVADIDQCYF